MEFLKGMRDQLNKIDKKLDLIHETLRTMDVKIDSVLKDTHALLKNQEAAARQQAERHQRVLDELYHDSGYYMYVAIQPPPVVAGSLGIRLEFQARVNQIAAECRKNKDLGDLGVAKFFPICLNDGAAQLVKSDLDDGNVHCLVWCAHGDGWEVESVESANAAPIGLEALLNGKLPELIVVVLKYGAMQAAEAISKRAPRGTVVLWVKADMLKQGMQGVIHMVAQVVRDLHDNDKMDPSQRRDEAERRVKEKSTILFGNPSMAGICSKGGITKLRWKPEEQAESAWVQVKTGEMIRSNCTNLIHVRQKLARQRAFSCDLSKIEELKKDLQGGARTIFILQVKDHNTTRENTPRCMAVALVVCSAFVLSESKFRLVYLLERADDMKKVKKELEHDDWPRGSHILLWAHLQGALDGQSSAEKGPKEKEYWSEDLTEQLVDLMATNANAQLILTTDGSRDWRLELEKIIEWIPRAQGQRDETSSRCAWRQDAEWVSLEPSKNEIAACPLHEEIKICVTMQKADLKTATSGTIAYSTGIESVDLLELFRSKMPALITVLQGALPGQRPIAALYRDSDEHGRFALLVRISISDVLDHGSRTQPSIACLSL